MKTIEEYPVAALSNCTPCGLVKWSLLTILIVVLLAPKDTVSLDCEFATKLYQDAVKECEAGVRHDGVKYQPCEYAKLLEPNYRTCTGAPPVEEPQSEFGLVMVLDHMIGYDQLIAAASQKGFKQAKLTALKSCMTVTGEARRCKELDRFGEVCFAVAEARYGTSNDFVTAEGNSRGEAEIEAIRWCKEYVPKSEPWAIHCRVAPSECSLDEILCAIEASGCSPYEVVDSIKEFQFRAPQTLEDVSKQHKEPAGRSDEPKTKEPSFGESPEVQRVLLEFEMKLLRQEIKDHFGERYLDAITKRETERKLRWIYRGMPRDKQGNVIFEAK